MQDHNQAVGQAEAPTLEADSAIVRKRVEQGMPWVRPIAAKVGMVTGFWNESEVDDLAQVGSMGLLSAARRFDPAKGDWKAFAQQRIRGAIQDSLGSTAPLSRRIYERLEQPEQLAKHCAGMAAAERSNLVVKQDHEGDFLSGRSSMGAETFTDRQRQREQMSEAIEDLATLQRNALGQHLQGESVRDIGASLGITKDRAHRVVSAALKKIASKLKSDR